MIVVTWFNHVTTKVHPSLSTGDVEDHVEDQWNRHAPPGCGNPSQVVRDARHYFGLHFPDPILMPDLVESLGTSLRCLNFGFDHIHGVTPSQALQEHRLSKLFAVLTDQPRQGLGRAIRACGLGGTASVSDLFEQELGIDMPLPLHISRRAADDRAFRREHPEAEVLVLPA